METYFDHGVLHNVIFESFQLEMQDRRKTLENDTLLGILEAITFRHILILALQSFFRNIIFERFFQVLASFHVQLNV